MVFTVGHSKGGVGKSTLAFNLAQALKKKGEKVTIVDLDFQQTLFFINSLNKDSQIEVLQPTSGSELIEIIEDHYGYLIIDVGGFDSDINRIALSRADKIIVPISNSVTDLIGFQTFEAILDEIDNPHINIVLNNIHPLVKDFKEIKDAIGTTKDTRLLKTVIRNRKVYKDSLKVGKSVLDFQDLKAIEEIQGFCDELIGY